MSEVAKNVYVTDTVVTHLLEDPRKWLEGRDGFDVRYVNGIHNLSINDKKGWAGQVNGPLRIIENGTGREEVWFHSTHKAPEYISVDKDGKLTSHMKYDRPQPTMIQDVNQKPLSGTLSLMVEFSVWYDDDHIHRAPEKNNVVPAVLSSKMRISIPDNEYLAGLSISIFREFWRDGAWESTSVQGLHPIFVKQSLNRPEVQEDAIDWIGKHCDGGFFPLSDTLFGDPEEEFLFLTDICSKG